MNDIERLLVKLAAIGGAIGLAKLFVTKEKITFRLLIGRIVLGSALAVSAGAVLIHIPSLGELELCGLACGLGITGQTGIEWFFTRGKKE